MRRTALTDDLYFVTITTVGWIDIFTRPAYKQYIVDNLIKCQIEKGLIIYAYVIMTNHLHLVCEVEKEKGTVSDWLRDFKSFTSKGLYKLIKENTRESRKEWMLKLFDQFGAANNLNKNFQIWQNDSQPTVLYFQSPDIIQQKVDYIHLNPVRAGIVPEAHMYLYSSAHAQNPLKLRGIF